MEVGYSQSKKNYPLTLNFGLLAFGRLTERWMANSFTYSDDQNLLCY